MGGGSPATHNLRISLLHHRAPVRVRYMSETPAGKQDSLGRTVSREGRSHVLHEFFTLFTSLLSRWPRVLAQVPARSGGRSRTPPAEGPRFSRPTRSGSQGSRTTPGGPRPAARPRLGRAPSATAPEGRGGPRGSPGRTARANPCSGCPERSRAARPGSFA